MTGSSNDRRNISASMSGAPSLVNSLNSFSSNSKLSISPSQVKSPIPEPTFVERSLEKAKFYTSLCLGEFQFQLFLFVFTHYVFYVVVHFLFILRFSYHRKIVSSFFSLNQIGTSAILSVFAFLFLIPFVVDPAITTILADFQQAPVTCIVVDHTIGRGMRNCSWSSCREGCTTAQTR